ENLPPSSERIAEDAENRPAVRFDLGDELRDLGGRLAGGELARGKAPRGRFRALLLLSRRHRSAPADLYCHATTRGRALRWQHRCKDSREGLGREHLSQP